jgi:hypothetical protein
MKKIKYIGLGLIAVLAITACDNDLDQSPPLEIESGGLTDFANVLNSAYHYQTGTCTPLAVMGDFRADNMLMEEEPYPAFDRYNSDLAGGDLVEQFFRPFYSNLYKAILSANNVIENSMDANEVAEAKFLRALSYFKLVKVFGDVSVVLTGQPSIDNTDLTRQPSAGIYTDIIIPDLEDAIVDLTNSVDSGRASVLAAQGLLGKVYMYRGNYGSAETQLAAVIAGASAQSVMLEANFADVVTDASSEIIFATQVSTSVPDEYSATEFPEWFAGDDTKAPLPLDTDLTAAFDAAGDTTRKALSIDTAESTGVKYQGGLEQDWIELRLSDVILLQAEAMNENNNATGSQSATILAMLDPIRTRAGLSSLSGTATTQATVRQAIANERRLELAMEGERWFDLVRTGTVDAEMGQTISPNYHVFPIPNSEILASNGVITQNAGY